MFTRKSKHRINVCSFPLKSRENEMIQRHERLANVENAETFY